MCAIAGVFTGSRPATGADVEAVEAMLGAQAHRGPDGGGLVREGPAVLGHRRLAIIEPSAQGAQPVRGDGVWLACNGEIYNFRDLQRRLAAAGYPCRTQSDAEVVLRGYEAWGIEGILRRIEGMFAFALLDTRSASGPVLFLARDRFGIKPLYVARTGDRLAFASEVRALVQAGAAASRLDPEAVIGYLALGSVPAPRTIRAGVKSLEPASFLRVGPAGSTTTRFWQLPPVGFGERPTAAELATTLRDVCREHLVAKMPVGVFLGGGVDATAVVSAAAVGAAETGEPLHTLTVVVDGDDGYERNAARSTAIRHGADHHEVRVTDEDFACCLPDFLGDLDQPTNDGLNTWFIARAARSLGLKAVLSGLGGDEVFLGYPHYQRLASGFGRLATRVPPVAWRPVAASAARVGRMRQDERIERFAYSSRHSSAAGWYLLARGIFPPDRIARLVGCDRSEVHELLAGDLAVPAVPTDVLAGVNYLELRRYLHDQLLRDADTFGMAHSIEVRVPLLDRRLVEMVTRVALRDRISVRTNKPLLVRASGDPAVEAASKRPKRGFTLPIGRWMRERPTLAYDILAAQTVLDPTEVRASWDDFVGGRVHWSRVWALVTLQAAAS